MFKYNELSDLIDGSLVTPLSKADDGSIRCLDKDGNECFHTFDEFDFDKLPSERALNSDNLESEVDGLIKDEETLEPEPVNPPETAEEENPNEDMTYQDMLDEMEKDDSIYDGSDDPEIIPDPEKPLSPEKEGFCDDLETETVVSLAGLQKKPGVSYAVWKDII